MALTPVRERIFAVNSRCPKHGVIPLEDGYCKQCEANPLNGLRPRFMVKCKSAGLGGLVYGKEYEVLFVVMDGRASSGPEHDSGYIVIDVKENQVLTTIFNADRFEILKDSK